MNLQKRARVVSTVFVAMGLALSAYILYATRMDNEVRRDLDLLLTIRLKVSDFRTVGFEYTLFREERPRVQMVAVLRSLHPLLGQLKVSPIFQTGEPQRLWQEAWNRLLDCETFISLLHDKALNPLQQEREQQMLGLFLLRGAALATAAEMLSQPLVVKDQKNRTLLKWTGIAAIFMLLGLPIVSMVLLRRTILRPIARLEGAVLAVAAGNQDVRIRSHHPGEFGQLARAFDNMLDRIQEMTAMLISAREAAETANRVKSAFIANMSHEIRTPMNGVLGMAQVLLTPNLKETERQDYARTILASGKTLLTLLNDILELSKIESGNVRLDRVAMRPSLVLEEVRRLFAQSANVKSLHFTARWVGPESETGYWVDPLRLHQILANLVGNAIKFTSSGTVCVEACEISRSGKTAQLEFSVADTGIGIAEDMRPLVFRPFSQIDSSITRKYGGTGLGLSIVQGLTKVMGGAVGFESEPGRGSYFWVRIYVELAEFILQTAEQEIQQNIPAIAGKILVVEDDPTNRKVIEVFLNHCGAIMRSVGNGQQAVNLITAEEETFDLILMDLHMPIMDGYAATKEIRRWECDACKKRHPIIAITADAFEEDRQRCLNTGMDDFITKPVDLEIMRATIHKWIGMDTPTPPLPLSDTSQPVDIPMISALIDDLIPLLEEARFEAIEGFHTLQAALTNTAVAQDLAKMASLIDQFRFDAALEELHLIMTVQGWVFPDRRSQPKETTRKDR